MYEYAVHFYDGEYIRVFADNTKDAKNVISFYYPSIDMDDIQNIQRTYNDN